MEMIKRYVLYGLVFNAVCLVGMDFFEDEKVALCVERVRNVIDIDHLGMTRNIWLRGVIGSCLSYYYSSVLSKEQIINEMNKIESQITLPDKELVLKKIAARHWYVNYLMQNLILDKVEEFNAVKGSTIDALYFPVHESAFKKIVHECALKKLFRKAGIKNPLSHVPVDNIDIAVLYGHTDDIHPNFLSMSCDGKYLLSTDRQKNEIVWDMEKGEKIDLDPASTQWISGYKVDDEGYFVIDNNNNYYATSVRFVENKEDHSPLYGWDYVTSNNVPVQIKKNSPAIILFKRPQGVLHLCKIAFERGKDDDQELLALRESKSIQCVKGFPQNNLKQLITEQINQ